MTGGVIREALARFGIDLDRDHQALRFVNRGIARKQRRGMAIVAKPQQHQVEAREFTVAEAERFSQLSFVCGSGRGWWVLASHPMHLVRPERELAQHRAIRHRVVALGVIGRDTSFVAPEKLNFLPIDTQAKARRQQIVSGGGSRTAREAQRELAVGADSLAGDVGDLFGGADVKLLRVVQDDELGFRHGNSSGDGVRLQG